MNKFKSLGVMLDCSRNAVMTVSELKKFLSLLARMRYNRFLLYLEDTYEVDGEEFFGYFRGRYTAEELKEIDDFAYSLGIEVIPCIQTLAHLNALFKWERYAQVKDIKDILLVGSPDTYALIEKMITSLKKCFRTKRIHIGMDEAADLGKGKYREINGEQDKNDILLYHLNKVCEIVKKCGFDEPMMWSDMFYRIANGGEYYKAQSTFDTSIKEKIPENLSLVYWDYYHIEKELYDDMIKGHKQLCDKTVFACGAWKWSGFVPHNELSVKATLKALSSCVENGIDDVFVTMWGDDGSESSPYSVLPTLVQTACFAQGITDEKEIKNRFFEWTGGDYDAFMLLDLPDKTADVPIDYVINPSKYELYNDCFMGIYDSAVDIGDGKLYGEFAEKIAGSVSKAGNYGYIFETISKLCNVLEYKSEIGIKTREIYLQNDKEKVVGLIIQYEEMIKRTEEFYRTFRFQWYKENKPHGFDVQDIRLGGLIMRMKDCCERLCDWRDGKIQSIPELEEKSLVYKEKKELIYKWHDTVTANVL